MPEHAATTTDHSAPNPKRFYWLKRFAVATLVTLVLLVGLRIVWGYVMQSRLDQAIADIQAKGEPILFEDLVYKPLADADNGAWYLMQAMQQWPNVPNNSGQDITETDWYNEGEEAGYTDPITNNAAYLASCQPVLDLLRQADEVERSDWGGAPTRPLFYMLLPHLGESRRLVRLVDDAARRALEVGDTELILETMRLQHAIARHVLGQHPVLIDSLVSISIMAMNRDFIEYALPRIDPAALRQGRPRELAEEMIARLTDGMMREGMINSFIGERAGAYDVYECMIDGTETAANLLYSGSPITFIIDTPGFNDAYRPALKDEQLMVVEMNTQIITALKNNASPSVYQKMESELESKVIDSPWRYPISYEFMPAYGGAIRTYHRSETMLRCTAVAIAIKLYEADHGKRPEMLDQLVPTYLSALPIDPFSKSAGPIRYNPQGIVPMLSETWHTDEQIKQLQQHAIRTYPLVYSVGEDETDQQGGPLFINEYGRLSDIDRYQQDGNPGDIWFMLEPWPEAIFTDQNLGIDNDPFEPEFPWDETPNDEDSETGHDEVEVEPGDGQADEDQGNRPQP